MFVGFARYDLRLPGCLSLKDKRSVLRALTSSLHRRFACAVAEVDGQDMHQRASVGVSVVSGTNYQARKVLQDVGRQVERTPGIEIIAVVSDVVAPED